MPGKINHNGQAVPTVAFYSVQGGVGKSTLARKFAELITRASGHDHKHPNVLLLDLDVDAMGLTYRLGQGAPIGNATIHEAIAARNPNVAAAQNVTANVSLLSAGIAQRGQLFLVPAAPPDATRVFDVITNIERPELLQLLCDAINRIVATYAISCVVIDCAPGAAPYSAAAATIADVPLLIGRNEDATYQQIHVLPRKFRELYPEFQPAGQRVVINAVSLRERYDEKARQYAVADWIPLTADVIHETEGLRNIASLRMLLFENYVTDLIKKFLVGHGHLIPQAHDVLPEKWMNMLSKLNRIQEARRMKLFRAIGRVGLPAGIVAVLMGIGCFVGREMGALADMKSSLMNAGLALSLVGVALVICGVYAIVERARIERDARDLLAEGPDGVFTRLEKEQSHRKSLDEMMRITESIQPAEA